MALARKKNTDSFIRAQHLNKKYNKLGKIINTFETENALKLPFTFPEKMDLFSSDSRENRFDFLYQIAVVG